MAKELKYMPRFAKAEDKQQNLIDFIESLEVKKEFNKKTKRERILNIEDFIIFNSLYQSCSEIAKHQSEITDRDSKAKVQTLITSSVLSKDLAFLANNVDGVTESIRNKITAYGDESDFKALTEAAKVWESTNKEINTLVEKLRNIVEENLKKGFGTPRQLRSYENKKLYENEDAIKKMYFQDGKTPEEIAEKIEIRHGLIQNLLIELVEKNLQEHIEDIRKALEDGKTRDELAEIYKTSRKKISNFINTRGLAPKQEKKTEPKKEAPKKKVTPAAKEKAKEASKETPKEASKEKITAEKKES